jgi:hypothetical protein
MILIPQVNRATLVTSAAFTSTFNSAVMSVGGFRRITSYLHVTARSGTTPTLAVQYHTSADPTFPAGGTFNLSNAPASTGTHTAYSSGSTIPSLDPIFMEISLEFIRATCTIAGTTPSWTFSLFVSASPS